MQAFASNICVAFRIEVNNMTSSGGDAAEQVVRMMLSGTEVSVRLAASATKNLVAISVALAQNHKKLYGKTKLKKMLKETRDIRVFPMTRQQYRQFEKQAKAFGLLYASIRNKDGSGMIDLVLPSTELDRANQVFQGIRYGLEPTKEQPETTPKNASRSEPDWSATRDKAIYKESGSRSQANEKPSVEAQLKGFQEKLKQASTKQKQQKSHKMQGR
jgi:hypothetical protein